MGVRVASLLLLVAFCRPCLAQDDVPPAPPSVFPERPVNWLKLVPNLARDQKDIWLFPISAAARRQVKPILVLSAITAATVAAVDVPSGKYFQQTHSFDGFNRAFSGKNTSIAMFAAPSVFYGISLLRKDSYSQHTFLLA